MSRAETLLEIGSSLVSRQIDDVDPSWLEELSLSQAFFETLVHSIGGKVIDSMEYSHSFPGLCAGVLGHDETQLHGNFRRCQEFFDASFQMRQISVDEDEVKALLDPILRRTTIGRGRS